MSLDKGEQNDHIDLPSVVNYRCPIKNHLYYRSARWDGADEEDAKRLKTEFATVLDLRSRVEIYLQPPPPKRVPLPRLLANKRYNVPSTIRAEVDDVHANDTHNLADSLTYQLVAPRSERYKKEEVVNFQNPDGTEQKIIYINFMGRTYQRNVFWKRLSWKTKFKVFTHILRFNKSEITKIIGNEVFAPRGLLGMTIDFIEYSKEGIQTALHHLANEKTPINLHCFRGGDRTGICTSLLLYILGYSDDYIADDYHKSEQGLAPILPDLIKFNESNGLPESFAYAPREVMLQVFEYIRKQYGNIDTYLYNIGVTQEDISLIRSKYV